MQFSRALIAGLVCSAFAAAVSAAPVTTQGTGVGKHGDVTVAVTFDSGKIKDIKIVKQQENPVLAAKVFTDLKQHVIDTNSVQLDAIYYEIANVTEIQAAWVSHQLDIG